MAVIQAMPSSHITLMVALSMIALGPAKCNAGPILHSSMASQLFRREDPAPTCSFAGNAELYGLGIRIGVYLQWVSGFLANIRNAESVRDMLATNTIFLLALFTALAIITQKESVESIEVAILLQLCFGFLFSVSTTWGLRVRARFTSSTDYGNKVYFPLLGSTIRVCLASAICSYNLWFWFRGLDKLSRPNCQPLGLLFAQVNLMRRARVFFQIWAVLMTILFGSATLSEMLLFSWNWACYATMAASITILIRLHGWAHAGGAKNETTQIQKPWWRSLAASLIKFMVVFVSVPWVMLNTDTGVHFKRRKSWLLLLQLIYLFQWLADLFSSFYSSPLNLLMGVSAVSFKTWKDSNDPSKETFEVHKRAKLLPIFNMIVLIWSIVAIELMIKWNGITDVHTIQSVGQLIPFIIGIVGFLRLLRDIQVETIQEYLYGLMMKSLLNFDQNNENIVEGKELNQENGTSESKLVAQVKVANISPEAGLEENSQDPSDSNRARTPLAIHSNPLSPVENAQTTVGEPPKAGNTVEERYPNRAKGMEATKILTSLPTIFQLLEYFLVLTSIWRNRKEEWKTAKDVEILQSSIGDKIVEIWRADANEVEVSVQKTNAILALDILSRFKSHDWKEFLKKLHRRGVNPHILAVRWFDEYTTFWWGHLKERWNIHRAEIRKGKKGKKRIPRESAAAVVL
ncbi:hypothetical protein N431DRAFT_144436 [Stipitochalara longipes BDJ]|nr:hypothetical protein N431DRAFT_144436 [Stipitochalara longipes BDJ]